MGVRRAGEAKRAFAPRLEIWIKNEIFLEKPEVGILIPINWFDSCNDSFIAGRKLTLHKSQVHSYSVMQWWACNQGRIKGGERGQLPRPLQGGPPWWYVFVLNKTAVWNFFVIQKRYKIATLYYIPNSNVVLSIMGPHKSNWFLYKCDCLPVFAISTE